MRSQSGDSFRVKLLADAPHAHHRGRAHHKTAMRSRLARGWERVLPRCYISSGFDAPRVSRHNKADEADDKAQAAHSPSQGYFIILGTETCSQNGDHSLRSRAERERAPTTKICAAIRWAVRQRFTLRRTGPRRVAAWRAKQSSARTRRRGTLRHSGISNFCVPNHVPKAVATVCAPERQHTNTNRASKPPCNHDQILDSEILRFWILK